jgi:hypothetical protein
VSYLAGILSPIFGFFIEMHLGCFVIAGAKCNIAGFPFNWLAMCITWIDDEKAASGQIHLSDGDLVITDLLARNSHSHV